MRRNVSCVMVIALLVSIVGAGSVQAGEEWPEPVALSAASLDAVRHWAVQHNGRLKPFDSFARESLDAITGHWQVGRQDPVLTALSIMANADAWQAVPLIAVPFRPLREPLGMAPRASHISYNDLVASRKLMRMLPPIIAKEQAGDKLTMAEQETMDAFGRFVAFSELAEQKIALVPTPPASKTVVWSVVTNAEEHNAETHAALREGWTAVITALRRGQSAEIDQVVQAMTAQLQAVNPAVYPARWRMRLESAYHRTAPFRIASVLYALTALLLAVAGSNTRVRTIAWTACIVAFLVHAGGIATRVVLGGRPPVSNFYETMLWLPFVAVTVALIFERFYRVRYFGIAAAVVASITLTLADFVPLDSSIAPVVAVLRSNLWLTVHVLTIVASYGALALATVLAHIYGGVFLRQRNHEALPSLELYLYRAIQVGVVLLAAGIMLGAVWANASWGRYWGWDPKETWALITLLWFIAALHGRFAGWLRGISLTLVTITGFFLLLMTYYGVSFYLVGLHSYAGGHAKPMPPILIGYAIAEIAFLAVLGVAARARRTAT